MLVLSRQAGQSVQIGDDVRVAILDVRGSVIKIGISAPDEVVIYRSELGQINRQASLTGRDHDRLAGIARQLRREP